MSLGDTKYECIRVCVNAGRCCKFHTPIKRKVIIKEEIICGKRYPHTSVQTIGFRCTLGNKPSGCVRSFRITVEHFPNNIGKPDTPIEPIKLPPRKHSKHTDNRFDIQTLENTLNDPIVLAGLSLEEVSTIRNAINQMRVS